MRRNLIEVNRKSIEIEKSSKFDGSESEGCRKCHGKVKFNLAGKHGNITACQQLNLSSCRYVIPASRNHITMTSEASSLVGDF